MITGTVTDSREAIIRLTVYGSANLQQEVTALIDTGFDGWLSLPKSLISFLQLEPRGHAAALLADGTRTVFDVFEARLKWDGQPRRIRVDEAETDPLVGMALLDGHELNIEIIPNGTVRIMSIQ